MPERQSMPKAGLVWARSRIRSLDASNREDEALVVAKEFNLLSSDAAFIAWDEAEQVPVAQTEIIQPALEVERHVSACMAPPDARYCAVMDEDASFDGSIQASRPGRWIRRRKKHLSSATILLGAPLALLLLPIALVAALVEHVSSRSRSTLRPEVAELVERLRQLVDMLYPSQSYPQEVRNALQRLQSLVATLEKCSDDEQRAVLTEEAVDNTERLLQVLREHSRYKQAELHDQARRFADLEHTAACLAVEFQTEVAKAKMMTAQQAA